MPGESIDVKNSVIRQITKQQIDRQTTDENDKLPFIRDLRSQFSSRNLIRLNFLTKTKHKQVSLKSSYASVLTLSIFISSFMCLHFLRFYFDYVSTFSYQYLFIFSFICIYLRIRILFISYRFPLFILIYVIFYYFFTFNFLATFLGIVLRSAMESASSAALGDAETFSCFCCCLRPKKKRRRRREDENTLRLRAVLHALKELGWNDTVMEFA